MRTKASSPLAADNNKMLHVGRETGSLTNYMMSACGALPEVGKGATELMWSDRHAYEVLRISDDYKTVIIRRYDAKRTDNNGFSDSQSYEYKDFIGPEIELRWRYGHYMKKVYDQEYDQEKQDWCPRIKEWYANECKEIDLKPYRWVTINIVFGIKDEHYDYSL